MASSLEVAKTRIREKIPGPLPFLVVPLCDQEAAMHAYGPRACMQQRQRCGRHTFQCPSLPFLVVPLDSIALAARFSFIVASLPGFRAFFLRPEFHCLFRVR